MITGHRVKPCPRCGAGQAYLHLMHLQLLPGAPYMVRCGHCGLIGARSEESEAAAVAAWNDTQEPPIEAEALGATATSAGAESKGVSAGDRVEEICRAHRDFCARREKEVRGRGFCGGQTVGNMPHKCKGCPYDSDWSCLVKFALEYEKGEVKMATDQETKPGNARAAEIAGEMLAIVIHDSDLLDVAKDKVEHAKALLAEKLEEPLRSEGEALFTKEFLETFCIGGKDAVRTILDAHPSLKPADDLLNEFFELASQEAPKAPNNQQINKTSYYQLPCGLFLEDYIDYKELDFKWGSAVKYEYRAGAKDGEPEGKDRSKRNHYICEIAARDGVAHAAALRQVRGYVAEARAWNPSSAVRNWYAPYPTDWNPSDE